MSEYSETSHQVLVKDENEEAPVNSEPVEVTPDAELGANVGPNSPPISETLPVADEFDGPSASLSLEEDSATSVENEVKSQPKIDSQQDSAARRHAAFKNSAFRDDDDDDEEADDNGNEGKPDTQGPATPSRTQLFDDDEDLGVDSARKEESASDSRALFDDDEDMTPEDGDDTDAEDDAEGYQENGGAGLYEFEGDEENGLDYVTLPVPPPVPAPEASDEIWLVGLPLSVSILPDLFDAEEMARKERIVNAEGAASKKKSFAQSMAPGKIRLRQDENGKISANARLVEFTDGSCALFIGTTVYEADARSEGKSILIEGSQAPLYRVHGVISHKRIFKPPNVSAMDGRNIRIQPNKEKRTRLTTVQKGAESELRLKRHLEEMELRQQEQMERKSKKKRTTTLDASFLEGEDV